MAERLFIRLLVGATLGLTLVAYMRAPVPVDTHGDPALPAPALEQVTLYRLEIALVAFYGCLLLATPAFSGLLRGRLPIEISTRGAKFAAKADEAAVEVAMSVGALEREVRQLMDKSEEARIEIQSLKELVGRDSTQPEVGSSP